jgi:hypothetical protein
MDRLKSFNSDASQTAIRGWLKSSFDVDPVVLVCCIAIEGTTATCDKPDDDELVSVSDLME